MRTASGIDVRYGLVGYGNDPTTSPYDNAFARTHLLDGGIFSDADHAADLEDAIDNLHFDSGGEDGWDAIEYALAEYPFRDEAAPVSTPFHYSLAA